MRFPIVKHFKYFMGLTLIVLVLGVVSVFTRGFNMGIDFTGGTLTWVLILPAAVSST